MTKGGWAIILARIVVHESNLSTDSLLSLLRAERLVKQLLSPHIPLDVPKPGHLSRNGQIAKQCKGIAGHIRLGQTGITTREDYLRHKNLSLSI